MNFTVIFSYQKINGETICYSLVFTPDPKFLKGTEHIFDLNKNFSHGPGYEEGDLAILLEKEGLIDTHGKPLKACVVTHEEGCGSPNDLNRLVADLEKEGIPTVVLKDERSDDD